jgi:hypothetical protein
MHTPTFTLHRPVLAYINIAEEYVEAKSPRLARLLREKRVEASLGVTPVYRYVVERIREIQVHRVPVAKRGGCLGISPHQSDS